MLSHAFNGNSSFLEFHWVVVCLSRQLFWFINVMYTLSARNIIPCLCGSSLILQNNWVSRALIISVNFPSASIIWYYSEYLTEKKKDNEISYPIEEFRCVVFLSIYIFNTL